LSKQRNIDIETDMKNKTILEPWWEG